MPRTYALLFCFFVSLSVLAQTNEEALPVLAVDSQIVLLKTKAKDLINTQPLVSKKYARRALTMLAQSKLDKKTQEAELTLILGGAYYNISQYDSALFSYKHALRIFKIKSQKKQIAFCQSEIARTHLKLSNYTEAIMYNELSLNTYSELNDPHGLAKAHSNIGNLYWYLNNLDKAEAYYQKAQQQYEKTNNTQGLAIIYNNMGEIKRAQNDIEQATRYHSLSLEYEKENKNEIGVATSLSNLGELFMSQNDAVVAKEYFIQALEKYGELNNIDGQALVLFNLCELEIGRQNYMQALNYVKQGETLMQDFQFGEINSKVQKLYATIYNQTGNYKKAYTALEKYHQINDSLQHQKNRQALQVLQIKHEIYRNEKEIKVLEENNQLKANQLKSQKRIIIFIILIMLIISILGVVIFSNNRKIKSGNKLLSQERNRLTITEKELKQNNEKLQKEEKRFRLIVENIPVMIVGINAEGRIVFWNKESQRLSGFSPDEIISDINGISKIFADKDCKNPKKKLLQNKNFQNKSCTLVCKDHTIRTIQWHNISASVPIPEWEAWFIGIDITTRTIFEQNIKQEKTILQTIINTIPDPIFFKNKQSEYMGCNPAFEKLIGQTQNNIIGKTDAWLNTTEHAPFIAQNDQQIIDLGQIIQTEIAVTLPNNTKALFDARKLPLLDSNQQIFGLLGILFNVTKRHEFEQILKLEKDKAQNADKLKTAFLANMSHEIRTPMNAIIGFSDLLMQKGVSESKKIRYLNYIKSSGKNLLNLINDIIDIAKIEAQQLKYEKVNFNVLNVLKELNSTFQTLKNNTPDKENIDLKLVFPPNIENIELHTDPMRFRQIFNNLIGNALKFTDSGYIHFGLEFAPDNSPVFFVEDTGIGIPPDKQEVIFERFGQVTEMYTKNKKGTGLGLAISKSLIEILGGNIQLYSEPNRGSKFSFALDGINIPNHQEIIPYQNTEIGVLLLSENYINKILFKKSLKGFRIQYYEDQNALLVEKLIRNNKIHLVLLDTDYSLSNQLKLQFHQNNIKLVYQLKDKTPNEEEQKTIANAFAYLNGNFKQSDVTQIIKKIINIYIQDD